MTGDSAAVSSAMAGFRDAYQDALLEKGAVLTLRPSQLPPVDAAFRPMAVQHEPQSVYDELVGTASAGGLPPIRYQSGGLDEKPICTVVCNILEGGELAFRDARGVSGSH